MERIVTEKSNRAEEPGRKIYGIWSAIFLLCFLGALLLAVAVGRGGRSAPPPTGGGIAVVDRPEEVYRRWHAAGEHGRVVVAVSRWLNFVDIDSGRILPVHNPQPLRVTNLAVEGEKQLSERNFLTLAVLRGVAREVINLVPEREYAAREASVRDVEGARASGGVIAIPYLGTPRRIATFASLPPRDETVLLYVNASFFRELQPEELLALLKEKHVRADDTVLCLSLGDSEVTDDERGRLRRFAGLLREGRR